ncbi:peroxisomal membrane protein 11A [Anoplophora glabripennis]|uniref:peroxisomal membrane protein 11A n=1 Tax=Anoplophora glabripennis TaxID=217634 RepID=UPI000875824E|nr:peroxisomal membrane protein 11A [Anoplophora glabripennis]XP_018567107.1 peroxisomal membrane protein 11A [Anoplophora glabripennis]
MNTLVKINNQTAGRDKIARLLQYLSRFMWHRLQQSNKEGVEGIKNLEYQLSTFRRLLRFGRFVESLYAVLPLFQEENASVKYPVILSKIANALFLLADHILWLGRTDLCTINTEKWSRISNKYWLYSITMSLVRDFYEISQIIKCQKHTVTPDSGINNFNDITKVLTRVISVVQSNQNVVIDTVKNGCDLFIPLTALGHAKLSPGTIGLLGAVSSIAGLLVLLDPQKKLTPS